MRTVSLLDFLRTGRLDGVGLGSSRAEVERCWGKGEYRIHETQPKCLYGYYGGVMLMFPADGSTLLLLEIDFSDRRSPSIGTGRELDCWVIRPEVGEELLLPRLEQEGLRFVRTDSRLPCHDPECRWCRSVDVRFDSGATLRFDYDDVRIGLQAVCVESPELTAMLSEKHNAEAL